MKTDSGIHVVGMRLLLKGLGKVNAERFIVLMKRENSITPNGGNNNSKMKRFTFSQKKPVKYAD